MLAEPFVRLMCGDVLEQLRLLPASHVQTVITSPPYYGLRSYGIPPTRWQDGSEIVLGDEPTLDGYLAHLVEIFREVRRVLRPDGTVWLNLGDCYAGGGKHVERKEIYDIPLDGKPSRPRQRNLTGKDLLMVPARAALALQGDGWVLRSDIIWAKALSFLASYSGSVMPESTRDRPVWAHEHVFLLAQEEKYFYDIDACREEYAASSRKDAMSLYRGKGRKAYAAAGVQNPSDVKRRVQASIADGTGRNLRNVWVIPKQNFPGAHFATFPERLVEPMVKLGTSERGACAECGTPVRRRVVREPVPEQVSLAFEEARAVTASETGRQDGHTSKRPSYRRKVLSTQWEPGCDCRYAVEGEVPAVPQVVMDIFNGSGRTGMVARKLGRSYIGIDLNPEYIRMAEEAIYGVDTGGGRGAGRDGGDAAGEGDSAAAHECADAAHPTGEGTPGDGEGVAESDGLLPERRCVSGPDGFAG